MIRQKFTSVVSVCVATLMFLLTGPANGQTTHSAKTTDGYCGSGLTESFVPEQMFGCKMSDACKAHDICYGACDPGGIKEGTDYCKQSEFSPERVAGKQACDTQLFWDISKANGNKWQCRALGGIYTTAVVIAGQGPFNGKPMPPQALKALVETSATPEEAQSKFKDLALQAKANQLDLSGLQRKGNTITVPALQTSPAKNSAMLELKQGASHQEITQAMQAWQNRSSASPSLLKNLNNTTGDTK
ncbi:MAG: hypothetical protein RJB34_1421 [Pseudomonadota bacterium]|jgi:hypothetical protein